MPLPMPSRNTEDANIVIFMKIFSRVAFGAALTFPIFGCVNDNNDFGRLYSRSLTLKQVKEKELVSVLRVIADVTDTSKKEVRKDMDGNDMFLYSSSDVVIFVRRKFDEPCGALGCSWKVDVSPADTARPEASQKEVVDTALTSMASAKSIQSHLHIES